MYVCVLICHINIAIFSVLYGLPYCYCVCMYCIAASHICHMYVCCNSDHHHLHFSRLKLIIPFSLPPKRALFALFPTTLFYACPACLCLRPLHLFPDDDDMIIGMEENESGSDQSRALFYRGSIMISTRAPDKKRRNREARRSGGIDVAASCIAEGSSSWWLLPILPNRLVFAARGGGGRL